MTYTLTQKKRFARKLRRKQTPAEKAMSLLWLFGFRAQRITPAGYIGDWYHRSLCVLVELDGYHHTTKKGQADDRTRDKHHRRWRILTIRFENSTVLNHRFYSYFRVLYLTLVWQLVRMWW